MLLPFIISKAIGIITMLGLMHFSLNQYMGVPFCVIANFWGIACIVVFMDSLVLVNDIKMVTLKYDCLVQKYKILENFLTEQKIAKFERENKFLQDIFNQGSLMTNNISLLQTNINEISVFLKTSCENSPNITNLKINCEIPTLKNNASLNFNIDNKQDINQRKTQFRDAVMKTKSLSFGNRNDKKIRKSIQKLNDSWSEIFSSQIEDSINVNLNFIETLKKSKSSPTLTSI